jgi:predicted DCC family thiol-disulfide oxidoreductase YuxK
MKRGLAAMPPPADKIVLFDGHCNLCSASVQFIVKRDYKSALKFASLQSDTGRKLCLEYGIDPDDMQTFVVVTPDSALMRSDAAIEVARQFRSLWRCLVVFKFVPRFLRDWAYSLIARNRYRLFGKSDACMMPTPELRARFLE